MSRAGALTAGIGLALAAWEGGQDQSAAAAHVSVLAVVALVLLGALVAGARRQEEGAAAWLAGPWRASRTAAPRWRAGVVTWLVLVLALVGWDLFSFASARGDLPTLSQLIGHVSAHWAGRSLLFAAWLALGAALALGWRRAR